MANIQVTVGSKGEVTIEVMDGNGQSCSDLTNAIERAVGNTVSDLKKPEFYNQDNQGQQQQVAGW